MSHGGVIGSGVAHNVRVSVGGAIMEASLHGDSYPCPVHGPQTIVASGFVNFQGIQHTLAHKDHATCGAEVVGESDNTFSDSTAD